MRQKLTELKWEIVQQTIIVIDFNSPFQELVEHLDQKKKKNQTDDRNNTITSLWLNWYS